MDKLYIGAICVLFNMKQMTDYGTEFRTPNQLHSYAIAEPVFTQHAYALYENKNDEIMAKLNKNINVNATDNNM